MSDAKAECEALLNVAFPFAEQMLASHGEFLPFGAVLTDFDEYAGVAGYDGDERPPSAEVIDRINAQFVRWARKHVYRATALVYDARVTAPATGQTTDAIAFALDHRDKFSVVVFIPYKLDAGVPIFSKAFTHRGEGRIFRPLKRHWSASAFFLLGHLRWAIIAGLRLLSGILDFAANRR